MTVRGDIPAVRVGIDPDVALAAGGDTSAFERNGLVAMAIPEKANATLTVRTSNGRFRSTFPLKLDEQNSRKRFTVALGTGSAHVELESFGGAIAVRRPGEPRSEIERSRRRHRSSGGEQDQP